MRNLSAQPDAELSDILGTDRADSRFGRSGRWLLLAALIIGTAIGYLFLRANDRAQTPRYETEVVSRGNLVVTVSATGALQPTNEVDVGSELSGLIEAVLVEDNDRVHKGQILARLDLAKFTHQRDKSRAGLESAEAKVVQLAATTKEARANLERLRTVLRLSGGKVPSQAELDTAEATLARALADTASARAAVSEARATLSVDGTNLAKAVIRSPINGVVLARKIEPGQTVAASLETPVLFTLAEDLAQMELQVKVDEADVGQVAAGQSATFSVDAYPTRRYPATIKRVGFGSQTTDNVVTYKTILTVSNDDLSLRPGMTATAEITTVTRDNVVLVSNAALRFTPPAKDDRPQSGGGIVARLLPRPPVSTPAKRSTVPPATSDARRVWVLRSGQLSALDITVGVTDGRFTEVVGGPMEPGMEVITDVQESST